MKNLSPSRIKKAVFTVCDSPGLLWFTCVPVLYTGTVEREQNCPLPTEGLNWWIRYDMMWWCCFWFMQRWKIYEEAFTLTDSCQHWHVGCVKGANINTDSESLSVPHEAVNFVLLLFSDSHQSSGFTWCPQLGLPRVKKGPRKRISVIQKAHDTNFLSTSFNWQKWWQPTSLMSSQPHKTHTLVEFCYLCVDLHWLP